MILKNVIGLRIDEKVGYGFQHIKYGLNYIFSMSYSLLESDRHCIRS